MELSAGGLAAPAEESIQFLRWLFAGKLLAPASLEAMQGFRATPPLGLFSKSTAPPSKFEGYCMGFVKIERAGVTLLGHGGLFTGHSAGLWHIPERGITIALYLNRGLLDQRAALDQVIHLVTRSSASPARPSGR